MEEKQEVLAALHRLALRVQRLQALPLVQIILTIPVAEEELAAVGMEAEAAEEARCRVLLNVALLVLLVVLVQVDPEDAHTPLVPLLILAPEVALEAVVLDMYILQTPQANIRRDVYSIVNIIYRTHRRLMELRALYLLLEVRKLDNLVLVMSVLLLYMSKLVPTFISSVLTKYSKSSILKVLEHSISILVINPITLLVW